MELQDLENLAVEYRSILGTEKASNWKRGEIALAIRTLHAESPKEKVIQKFLQATGESRSLFNQSAWVVEKFAGSSLTSLPGLTWSHFRAAAGTSDPEGWIKKAYDKDWSIKALIDAISAEKDQEKIASGVTCETCECDIADDMLVVSHQRKRHFFDKPKCAIAFLHSLELPEDGSIPD